MDCIILAGGTPAIDSPFYPMTQGNPKALLEIKGRPMIAHVLEAIQQVQQIDTIVVVGLDKTQYLIAAENVYQIPDQGGMVQNGLAGFRWLKSYRQQKAHTLLCTADIPLITSEIVDALIANCHPLDHALYYHFVSREVMTQRFPNSNRTFVKLKGGQIAGADIMVVHTQVTEDRDALWEALTNGRKHAWKLARIVGPLFLLKFLFRQIGIREIEANATKILKLPIRVILSPFAEVGMDIDKPAHLDIIQTYVK